MKTLSDYKAEYDKLTEKKNLKGKEALEAVKQNGYALRYVNEPMFGNVKERTLADVLAGLDAEDKAIVRAAVKE